MFSFFRRKPATDTMSLSEQSVLDSLKQFADPNTGKDYVASRAVKNLRVSGADVSFDIELGYPAKTQIDAIRAALIAQVKAVPGVGNVSANVYRRSSPRGAAGREAAAGGEEHHRGGLGQGRRGQEHHGGQPGAGAGGRRGRVGMLDADIYGPSQPQMLGIGGERPESHDGKTMEPLEAHGLQVMSIGFLVDVETPMVWRGPMATQALNQLLKDTHWQDLDYLIIDMPPGTGDIQLTLSQTVPVTGAVIVTTPQDIALLDARKGLKMFEKVGVPIIGIVENMSIHICSKCGHEEHIFGAGGGEAMCKDYGVPFLGALPLDIQIRKEVDSGVPTVVADPDGRVAELYKGIARRVAITVAERAKDMSHKFPNIVVQNT
jgi:ATP-binding protein involved in chromosome partitioning